MRILALHLTNVRKFTGKRASITGIDHWHRSRDHRGVRSERIRQIHLF